MCAYASRTKRSGRQRSSSNRAPKTSSPSCCVCGHVSLWTCSSDAKMSPKMYDSVYACEREHMTRVLSTEHAHPLTRTQNHLIQSGRTLLCPVTTDLYNCVQLLYSCALRRLRRRKGWILCGVLTVFRIGCSKRCRTDWSKFPRKRWKTG